MNKTKVLGVKTKDGLQTMQQPIIAADALFNQDAGFGGSLDKSNQVAWLPNTLSTDYQTLASMYQYWLPRRIVDLIPNEGLRKGWKHKCESLSEDQIQELEKAERKYNVKDHFKRAWKWSRLFGGGLVVYLFDQSEGLYSEEIKPENIREGSLIRLDSYDPWQSYAANIEANDILSNNYRKPTSYTLGAPGYMVVNKNGSDPGNRKSGPMDGAIIHTSRCARFEGLELPWYTYQQNWYWGQSLLASVNEAIRNADLVTQSVAQLLFKLSVPVFKVKDLTNIVADDIARGAFLQRMNLLNTNMSNNHMAIIDAEEDLHNLEQSGISGIDALIERFFVIVSAATGIPVTKLVGESARGLNSTGEGDEKNFYNTVEGARDDEFATQLDKFYDMFFPAVLGIERPHDHSIEYNSLYQESPEQIANVQSTQVNFLSTLFADGVINKKVYIEEIRSREIITSIDEKAQKELEEEGFEDPSYVNDALELGGTSLEEQENPYGEM